MPKIPGAVRFQGSSGVQWVRILIPETKKIPKQDRKRLQRWLDLVDWKVQLEVTNHRRQKEGIRQHMESQMSVLRGKVRRSHSGWNFIKGHSNTDQEAREPQATSRGAVSQRMQGILQRYHSEGFSGDAEDWVLRMTQMHPKSVLQSVWSVMWQVTAGQGDRKTHRNSRRLDCREITAGVEHQVAAAISTCGHS